MAYVGTARRRGSARDTLASVIQGEAAGEGLTGMRAVAGVIGNRARTNFSGHGNDYVSQATARMQFQGQATPGAQAYQVADELLAGTLQDPTGGALYYANPGASTARWARNLDASNSLVIGNHYFTDNAEGRPFTGNGATVQTVSDDGSNEITVGGGGTSDAGNRLSWATPASDPRWGQADANGDGEVSVAELKQYNQAQEALDAAKSASAGSKGVAGSIPRAIVEAGNQQAKATASAAQAQAKTAAANTAAINATNTGIWSGFQNWLGGRVLQIFVFILAAIFIAVGLYMFVPRNTIAIPGLPSTS